MRTQPDSNCAHAVPHQSAGRSGLQWREAPGPRFSCRADKAFGLSNPYLSDHGTRPLATEAGEAGSEAHKQPSSISGHALVIPLLAIHLREPTGGEGTLGQRIILNPFTSSWCGLSQQPYPPSPSNNRISRSQHVQTGPTLSHSSPRALGFGHADRTAQAAASSFPSFIYCQNIERPRLESPPIPCPVPCVGSCVVWLIINVSAYSLALGFLCRPPCAPPAPNTLTATAQIHLFY